jgi:hypothetical protein
MSNLEQKLAVDLLASYKKANKIRKQGMLEKYGFNTDKDFIDHLNLLIAGKVKSSEPIKIPTVHNVYILDASTSMAGPKFNNAVAGINAEVEKLKSDKNVNYTQSIVDFSYNNDIVTHFWKVPISEVQLFKSKSRGSTALFQAAGNTIERLFQEDNGVDKVLIKIFTDGQENDSKYGKYANIGDSWRPKCPNLAKLIKDCEDKGFTITFVGTESDVKFVTDALNIDESNTLVHDNTAAGVAMSFARGADATIAYSQNLRAGKDVKKGFYKTVGKL